MHDGTRLAVSTTIIASSHTLRRGSLSSHPQVLEALLEHQPPQDAGLDAGFTAYAFYSLFSRRSKSDPPTLFEDGFAELKVGGWSISNRVIIG